MNATMRVALLVAGLTVSPPASALAQEVQASAKPAPADQPFGASEAIDENELLKVAGQADTGATVSSATQRNTVSNNSVTGTSTTGNIRIDGNAFQNFQGLAVISANSGNNVAINSAMNVSVNLAPR